MVKPHAKSGDIGNVRGDFVHKTSGDTVTTIDMVTFLKDDYMCTLADCNFVKVRENGDFVLKKITVDSLHFNIPGYTIIYNARFIGYDTVQNKVLYT